ncbi:acetaldehyde dehydrogenase (acetylating) [Peristeroidobacter soli]|jgi:acetaldehyde dehydrogenase|uniref:acetaldehyde dehydrogenase (acetylating) n=1 Tax=Peristeroidobacter soli TaxID=2497877 RepID=UPI00101CDE55|nr:acetaldehyde dehydrogenase (acetylating) [Peristeroidobacter soli]
MDTTARVPVAIIGSGNIGTDLMIKILRTSRTLRMAAMVGVDPQSEGLARARRLGVATTSQGIDGFRAMPEFKDVRLVFDATSAGAHKHHDSILRAQGKTLIDLTPAAVGPFVIPPVNGDQHLGAPNLNMVTCGGQATIPIVAAVGKVAPVLYAEIVASIASKSAGPGTRANIDEFTETTARAIEQVGGAQHGKAIIVLNPAEPPLVMRDTVYCLTALADESAIEASVQNMVSEVQSYVPGYRLKQRVQFERVGPGIKLPFKGVDESFVGLKVSVFLEVEGAAHYLPAYAGNLDIMTSAALRTAERVALNLREEIAA